MLTLVSHIFLDHLFQDTFWEKKMVTIKKCSTHKSELKLFTLTEADSKLL